LRDLDRGEGSRTARQEATLQRVLGASTRDRLGFLASSSLKSYDSVYRAVLKAQEAMGVRLWPPTSVARIDTFVSYQLEISPVAPSTVLTRLNAVKSFLDYAKHKVDKVKDSELLDAVWWKRYRKAVARRAGFNTAKIRRKEPLLFKDLLRLLQGLHWQSHVRDARDAAWLVLAFFGMRRKSEILFSAAEERGLRMQDVRFRKGHIELHIRKQKNHQFMAQSILIAGTTGSGVPVSDILKSYVRLANLSNAEPDSPFVRTTQGTRATEKPYKDYRSRFQKLLRDILGWSAEKAAMYATHSLRRGGATWAKTNGSRGRHLKGQGLWTSKCFNLYDKKSRRRRLRVTHNM
jgi:hypothetical protein